MYPEPECPCDRCSSYTTGSCPGCLGDVCEQYLHWAGQMDAYYDLIDGQAVSDR